MDVFTLVPSRCWLARLSGRNALVRRSDRVQALLAVVAIVVVMLAAPVAAATGTAIHDVRAHVYAEQARHRHPVVVTAVGDSTTTGTPNSVKLTWPRGGMPSGAPRRAGRVAAIGQGGRAIFDLDGRRRQPGATAAIAQPGWQGRGGRRGGAVDVRRSGCGGTHGVIRHRLDRARHAGWDREFAALTDGGGRRNHQS